MESRNDRRKRKLALLRDRTDGGLRGIASRADVNYDYLDQILKGTLLPAKADGTRSARKLGDKVAETIEDVFKLGHGWFDSDADNTPESEQPPAMSQRAGPDETDSSLQLTIAQWATGGAMGHGLVLPDQPGIIRSMSVSQEWIQKNVRNFTSLRNLAIVTGFGDSMKPLYNPGDPLLVDTGINTVDFEAIYFFRVGDEGFVKRLQRIPGQGLLVISDNTKYRDWTMPADADFEIFGRIIKVWRGEDF